MTPVPVNDGPWLAIVADSGPGVGAGHLGRCLALAQAWIAAGGRVRLVDHPPAPADWRARYGSAGVDVTPRPEIPDPAVLVVDGYRYGDGELDDLAAGAPRVVIDDGATGGLGPAALVVDQNLGATADRYPQADRVLAGLRYLLLRHDFVAARPATPPQRDQAPRRVLLAPGGGPTDEVAAWFAEVGDELRRRLSLDVVELRGRTDVAAALADVDLAVAAAGTTTWELAVLGVPAVVVAVADNQRIVARAVGERGVAVDAGDRADRTPADVADLVAGLVGSPHRRRDLARNGWALIDGLGARRVATAARALTVSLRPVGPDDAELLWRWTNDPAVRAASFDPTPIPWDDHRAWFVRQLARTDAWHWIAADASGRPIGQFRVDGTDDGTGRVGVSVAPDRRGQGWAGPLIAAASMRAERVAGGWRPSALVAEIRPENHRSVAAFVAADYDPLPDGTHGDTPCRRYHRRLHG